MTAVGKFSSGGFTEFCQLLRNREQSVMSRSHEMQQVKMRRYLARVLYNVLPLTRPLKQKSQKRYLLLQDLLTTVSASSHPHAVLQKNERVDLETSVICCI